MVGTSPCISFNSTSLSQVDGFLKYEPKETCQENEALWSTLMVISGPRSLGFPFGVKKYTNRTTLSPSTLHMNSMHDSHSI